MGCTCSQAEQRHGSPPAWGPSAHSRPLSPHPLCRIQFAGRTGCRLQLTAELPHACARACSTHRHRRRRLPQVCSSHSDSPLFHDRGGTLHCRLWCVVPPGRKCAAGWWQWATGTSQALTHHLMRTPQPTRARCSAVPGMTRAQQKSSGASYTIPEQQQQQQGAPGGAPRLAITATTLRPAWGLPRCWAQQRGLVPAAAYRAAAHRRPSAPRW